MRLLLTCALILALAANLWGAAAAVSRWVPGVRIALEVRTPAGELRTYHTPPKFTYWTPELPVIEGDRVTVDAFVALGGGDMGQVKIRLDNEQLAQLSKGPWKLDLPADKLTPGYHFLEVFASERRGGKWSSATLSFLVVPATEPSIQVALSPQAAAGVTVSEPAPGDTPTGPTATVRSRSEEADKSIREGKPVTVSQTTLFWIETEGKRFFYTLERDGVITYRSPALPLNTQILMQPKQADGSGLDPGKLVMRVRAGDLAGNFGPAAEVTLDIQAAQK